ncbi:protein of unknown function [Tessaracoccus bendigoensis DSM 12906]|uniref:Uncharacterized protein n=1 Tax=Tessaracoccus bendigoensis DSM 12906 TaxID=1123357 RepID=A0A1M6H0U9_9ACTN|nr:DUF2017 family protein [Tessaracoccus bendigoensis]SHJ15744.1 protein of unknown function [Tessaracoccus bendigoensis DSM 12906]
MTLEPDDIVWAFDGRVGRDGGLGAMIGFYVSGLRELLPSGVDSDDPFEQIVAELSDDPTNRMLSNPRLSRLFPPALANETQADEFWRDSIHNQTRARIAAADAVMADLGAFDGFVPVRLSVVDDWARTLGALRLFWYAEVAGPERLAEPEAEVIESNPGLAELVEWLGYLLEDLLESRGMCLATGQSLDPDQFTASGRGLG